MFGLNAWDVSFIGLAIGGLLGVAAMIWPRWAARLVRLQQAAPGGVAEFRATYGGFFAGAHGAALGFLWVHLGADDFGATAMAAGAVAILSAAWGGSAAGRLVSLALDKSATKFNGLSIAFELAMSALIGAPWIAWTATALLT